MRANLRPLVVSAALLAGGFTAGWFSRPDGSENASQESSARRARRAHAAGQSSAAGGAAQSSSVDNLAGLLQADQELINSGRGRGTNEKLLALFKEVLASQPESVRRARMEAIFSAITAEDTHAIRKHFANLYVASGQDMVAEYEIFMYHWARVEGTDVFRQLDEEKHGWEQGRFLLARDLAQLHPEQAAELARETSGRDFSEAIHRGIAAGLLRTDPAAALSFMAQHPSKSKAASYATQMMREMIQHSGVEKAGQWLNLAAQMSAAQPEQSLNWFTGPAESAFNGVNHFMDPAAWRSLIERQPDGVWPGVKTYATLADSIMEKENPQAAAAWCVGSVPKAKRSDPALWKGVMDSWAGKSPDAAGTWLQSQRGTPHYDAAASMFCGVIRKIDPDAAQKWAETIGNAELRTKALGQQKGSPAPAGQ